MVATSTLQNARLFVQVNMDRVEMCAVAGGEAAVRIDGAAGRPLAIDFSHGPIDFANVERQILRAALDHTNGNVVQAASLLGLSRDTMRYRVDKFGLGATR